MSGTNYILEFADSAEPPFIETDEEYAADPDRDAGWEPGVVQQPFLNKLHKQAITPAAGLSQLVADNQEEDVLDALTPAEYAALLLSALQSINFITQPKFDDSEKVATTEFVQNALGSFSTVNTYSINTILGETDVGSVVNSENNNLTFTLPLAADCPIGSKIIVAANGFTGLVVQRQGSNVINNGAALALSNITTIGANDICEFTNFGIISSIGTWQVTGGNPQLNQSSQFKQSRTANGYIKLPGDVPLILQWGLATLPNSNASISTTTVNFNIPYQNNVFGILATGANGSHINTANGDGAICSTLNRTLTNFGLVGDSNNSLLKFNQTYPVFWFSIGN